MNKIAWWFLIIYLVYIGVMALYLFVWTSTGVPPDVKGTAADPHLFMTTKQLSLSQDFTRINYLLYFVSIPIEWGIYLFVLIFGFSKWLRNRSEEVSRFSIVHTGLFILTLSVISYIISLPVSWISHQVSLDYGISVQSFSGWISDSLTSFWINWLITFVTVVAIYFCIRKSPKKWWLPIWLISIPFTLFLMFIQPVVIDPIYNDFYPLKDGQLKTEILNLASKADIPAENVYEVNMSEKTNSLNAYVNGIGSNLRIVLWDTTIKHLDDDEILFVMAHEMGHYVMHHLLWSLLGAVISTLVGLYIAAKLLIWSVNKWGERLGIKHPGDLASLPLLLLIISLLSFAASPIENAVSRHYEHAADEYAVKLTHDKEAGVSSFQKLTVAGLSDVNPPGLVKIFMLGHPTMLERITFIEHYKKGK